jgi:hypothetical protein
MTSWPLTDGQTNPVRPASKRPNTAQPASGHANSVQHGSSQSNPGRPGSARSDQTHPAGHEAGNSQAYFSSRPPLPDPTLTAPSVAARTGGYLAIVSRRGARQVPTHSGMLRRRLMINASKFLLPAAAVLLLSSIAPWPQLNTGADRARSMKATAPRRRATGISKH